MFTKWGTKKFWVGKRIGQFYDRSIEVILSKEQRNERINTRIAAKNEGTLIFV